MPRSMLYLDIQGKAPRRRCNEVVKWFKAKYMPLHHLDITITHRGMKKEHAMGLCTVIDCDHRPREFLIEMETTLCKEDYISTLLHELWHVWQHVNGSLRDKRGIRHWKNIDADHLSYEDQPWEHEAKMMENILYNDFMSVNDDPIIFYNRLTKPSI